MVFNSNLPTKLEFRVAVEDRFAQKSIDVYRGFVQLFTDASEACHQSLLDNNRLTADHQASAKPRVRVSLSTELLADKSFASTIRLHMVHTGKRRTEYKLTN